MFWSSVVRREVMMIEDGANYMDGRDVDFIYFGERMGWPIIMLRLSAI